MGSKVNAPAKSPQAACRLRRFLGLCATFGIDIKGVCTIKGTIGRSSFRRAANLNLPFLRFTYVRILVPQLEFAADLTCMLFCLLFNPAFNTDFPHFSQVVYDVLMMTDSVYNMDFAEVKKPLAWEFRAFEAMPHSMLVCTGTEPVCAGDAGTFHLIRKASVTFLRIAGARAAK